MTNDTAFITIASASELPQYKRLHASIQKFLKGKVDTLLYYRDEELPRDHRDVEISVRNYEGTNIMAIQNGFTKGYRTIIYVDPSLEFLETPWEILQFANDYRPGVFDQAFLIWKKRMMFSKLFGYRNIKAVSDLLEDHYLDYINIQGLTRVMFSNETPYVRIQNEEG